MTRNLFVSLTLSATLSLLIFSSACKHEPELFTIVDPIDTSDNNTSTCDPDSIYFTQQVLPLLQSGCAQSGCHDASAHEEGVILDSYLHIMNTGGINISDPTRSKIYKQMVKSGEERMPPPPAPAFTSEQLALIQKWIGQGAKNNSCIESGCDTANVAYATHIKPLIQNNCLGCHNGSNPGGGIGLSTYSEVKAVADNGKFFGTINHLQGYSAMPKNGNKLTDCQIKMVQIWLNQGSPDN
jgi:uncharacterized membrane protein